MVELWRMDLESITTKFIFCLNQRLFKFCYTRRFERQTTYRDKFSGWCTHFFKMSEVLATLSKDFSILTEDFGKLTEVFTKLTEPKIQPVKSCPNPLGTLSGPLFFPNINCPKKADNCPNPIHLSKYRHFIFKNRAFYHSIEKTIQSLPKLLNGHRLATTLFSPNKKCKWSMCDHLHFLYWNFIFLHIFFKI